MRRKFIARGIIHIADAAQMRITSSVKPRLSVWRLLIFPLLNLSVVLSDSLMFSLAIAIAQPQSGDVKDKNPVISRDSGEAKVKNPVISKEMARHSSRRRQIRLRQIRKVC
ncbi:hypothetical protein ACFSFZ_16120 [Mixta tenebrionis]|uniref:Uncharacterized protein n=1 Tax=Mixta tenebrionis TaxID=2562439 RepID=A0A506V7C7_9GAMM|nr:hypothetical protein [Mixta tenebrionis]TPW41751.1 hypothetical protein FKM52_13445 [Mixta tenebrionis]